MAIKLVQWQCVNPEQAEGAIDMDGCLSPLAVELHAKLATGLEEEEEEGRRELGVERDWAREQRMKERVQTTRGLLLHLPGSCRFNDDISYSGDDWNTYVRGSFSVYHTPKKLSLSDLILYQI